MLEGPKHQPFPRSPLSRPLPHRGQAWPSHAFGALFPAALFLATLPLAGCADGDADYPLTDASQFRYDASLSAEVVSLAAGEDAVIHWENLSRDVQGHSRDPVRDIDSVWLVAFQGQTPESILEGLATDTLPQSAVSLFQMCTPSPLEGGASCRLSEFGLGGSMLDTSTVFLDEDSLWLVVLVDEEVPGGSAFLFLRPDAESTVVEAEIGDGSSRLAVDVDFTSAAPLGVPADTPDVTIGWGGVTLDGLGNPFHPPGLDSLFLGRFRGGREDLQGAVFDLEAEAEVSWTMPLGGETEVSLADLQGAVPFPGISPADPGTTWLLALRCSSCNNPAPRLVSFLEGASPDGSSPDGSPPEDSTAGSGE